MEDKREYYIELWEGLGNPSFRVFAVQNMLKYLKFPNAGTDGVYGPITQGNIKMFQRMKGLEPDGVIGVETMKALAETCILTKNE